MRKKWKTISMLLFVLAFFLIFSSFKNITGLAILDTAKPVVPILGVFVLMIAIIAYGLSMMAAPVALEDRLLHRSSVSTPPQGFKVYISQQAIERAKRDPRIRDMIGSYGKEINMIASAPETRQQERIGSFRVSPQGRSTSGLRVAWHIGRNKAGEKAVYVDDFLYHTGGLDYVDRWNIKARSGRIQTSNYDGYKELKA